MRRAFAAVALVALLGTAIVRGAAAQNASPPPLAGGAPPSPSPKQSAPPAASPKPKASPQPKAAPVPPRPRPTGAPSRKTAQVRRPEAATPSSRPKPAPAARRAGKQGRRAVAVVAAPRLVRRDLGISFVPPASYRAAPAGQGVAYACTGPADDGVAATVHLLVQPAPLGEVPPGFAAALAEKLGAAFPPAAELRVVSQGETRVAGVRAAVLSATLTARGRCLRNCQVAFSRGGRRYLFTFTASDVAFEERVKAFFALVESVRWA